MNKDLDKLLDTCIDRMNEGDSLEECLASYPEQAKELEPLLRAVWGFRDSTSIIPKASAKSVMRRRLDAALVNSDRRLQERRRRTKPLFGWARAWATVAIVLVLAVIGYGLYWFLTPEVAPVVAQANFRLLLSDQENDIGDFESLEVTITSIGMLGAGEEGGWEVIELEESVVRDLTRLQRLNAQEIWGGIIPEGQYTQVFVYIEDAVGTLKNGETVDVIIPSGNIQISKPFVVGSGDSVVNFVYDITVVAAGNEFVLLPQVDESGPEQEFHELGEGKLTLSVIDTGTPVTPGDNVTVVVTFQDDPLPGTQVRVNGVDVGNTSGKAGQEGRISFTVPYDEELEVKAKITTELGDLEGDLKIEFGDELIIEVVEGVVAPGQSIELQVTLETLQGITVPIPGAKVEVKDVGVFTTDGDGYTLPFAVPYDDELEIKAVKGELEGELEIDLEREFEEVELTIQIVEGEAIPGESVTILVTLRENPVEDALVKVKDVGVFTTDGDGYTLPFTVPYDDELEIKAVKGELEGELEIDLEEEFAEVELTIQIIEGEAIPGGSITILITFRENPVEGALVKVEDVGVFITSGDGRISFIVPYEDELEIKAVKGKLEGEFEIELREADEEEVEELEFKGIIEAIEGTIWTMTIDGETRTVDVSQAEIEGEPAIGLEAEIKGTVIDNTIVASVVEVREAEEEEAEELEFEGIIDTIDGNTWTMTIEDGTMTVDVSEADIEGGPAVGLEAVVKGTLVDGIIVASEVEVRETEEEEAEELEFEGIIDTIDGNTWTMTIEDGTMTVDVSEAEIEGEPAVGLEAEIKGTVIDNTIVASEVEVREAEEEEAEELEFEGIIDTIDGNTWTMTIEDGTMTVDVSEADIEGGPAVGLEAVVKGTLVDGIIVASEVEVREV